MGEAPTKINPYDWINPVQTKDLFAGRSDEIAKTMEELTKLKIGNQSCPTVAFIGERRVGKTSLLRRAQVSCKDESLASVIVNVGDRMATDIWEFWKEIYYALLSLTYEVGITLVSEQSRPMGFIVPERSISDAAKSLITDDLKFSTLYQIHMSAPDSVTLSYQIIGHDLGVFIAAFKQVGYDGCVIMLDEAHNLLDAMDVKQHLRNIIQRTSGWGIIFSGESSLGRIFTDTSEPFFGQANVIRIDNFIKLNDVSECALLPLQESEIKLISPMTINYLAKLSQGKPNQIRLICSSIYKRYMRELQSDLNITIDLLDDVLEDVAATYRDTELKNLVNSIQKLDSVNLEILHNMTRYADWSLQDIINLDESFRGESKSNVAIERRRQLLAAKKDEFAKLGLMDERENVYRLCGGEFLSLYLRFYYETRKYGALSRKLVLGIGPPTLFGETTEKLVRSLAYHFGQKLELQRLIFHQYQRDFGYILETVKRRFAALEDLRNGKKLAYKDANELLSECFAVCELIGKPGQYYLLCLSVRNRDNPRELIQIELYFDGRDKLPVDLNSLFNLLNKQADEARVLIDGYYGFGIDLPDFPGLLKATGLTFDDLVTKMSLVSKWWFSSIQHAIDSREHERGTSKDNASVDDNKDDDTTNRWIKLYGKGEASKAEALLAQQIGNNPARHQRARIYNDLGYIRSGQKGEGLKVAYKDLETALDLHPSHVQLTLLNLSFLDINNENYDRAIERIEAALFLCLSPTEINAAYLRLRVPDYAIGFINSWEQHPANVIEASYVNLAYALLKSGKDPKAIATLNEGLELMPSSMRLMHAFARFHLHNNNVRAAHEMYEKLGKSTQGLDEALLREVRYFNSRSRRNRAKSIRRKGTK